MLQVVAVKEGINRLSDWAKEHIIQKRVRGTPLPSLVSHQWIDHLGHKSQWPQEEEVSFPHLLQ